MSLAFDLQVSTGINSPGLFCAHYRFRQTLKHLTVLRAKATPRFSNESMALHSMASAVEPVWVVSNMFGVSSSSSNS
jgi:hypothetical protein